MGREIEFTTNYGDLSTDNGFQFEFRCMRCGSGYRTEFDTYELSAATNVLDGASSLLGGFFSQASDVANRAKSAAGRRRATRPSSRRRRRSCPSSSSARAAASGCAASTAGTTRRALQAVRARPRGRDGAAQASKSVEEVWAHAKMSEEDKHLTEEDWREGIVASCPKCGAPQATNAKFCAAVRHGPQGREALHPVRRKAAARREVLQRMRITLGVSNAAQRHKVTFAAANPRIAGAISDDFHTIAVL